MKKVTLDNYKSDKYYPRVVKAVANILKEKDIVRPVDILIEMGNLHIRDYENWRKGKVPYLERVFQANLSKASRILRIIGFHVHDLNMIPKKAVYYQSGNSGKNRVLIFTKTGEEKIEEAYSKYYQWNQSIEKKTAMIQDVLSRFK